MLYTLTDGVETYTFTEDQIIDYCNHHFAEYSEEDLPEDWIDQGILWWDNFNDAYDFLSSEGIVIVRVIDNG